MFLFAADGTLGDLLKRAGEVAGGGAVVGATVGLIVGSFSADLDRLRNPSASPEAGRKRIDRLIGKGGALGGLFGLSVLIMERL
jgi:hypothetical protein